jgi:hypothetical protein
LSDFDKQKAEQLDRLFKHLKHPDGPKKFKDDPKVVQGLDKELVDALSKLDPKELRVISHLNEKLVDAGFGVSPEFRVSMV